MIRKIFVLCAASGLALSAAGCGEAASSVSYTYDLDSGERVSVSMDTSGGYEMGSDIPLEISLDGETVSNGTFVDASVFSEYESVVSEDPDAELIESGESEGNKYIFWEYADSEYNYLVSIEGTEAALLLGNPVSRESAEDVFSRLSISPAE